MHGIGHARASNGWKGEHMERELGDHMYQVIKGIACTCRRQFLYHGEGVEMCQRCRVMIDYEKSTMGVSETESRFKEIIV